jgi:lipopolysaccharide/colanic/teichoic acid biosynthesis glycosyltransferase
MLEFRLDATKRLSRRDHPFPLRFVAKRSVDVVVTVLLLLVFLPVMGIAALLLKLESPGPVLFRQARQGSRPGWNGGVAQWQPRVFRVYKFRSMLHNADSDLHEEHVRRFVAGQISTGSGHARYKLEHDERVTPIGRFLRRTSLDELPQLFNVLLGDMSLVGPRPVPLYEAALYEAEHLERLAVLPGLTGLWQVNGRCDVGFDEMIRLDLQYVREQSLLLDLKILALTIPAVIRGRGAA